MKTTIPLFCIVLIFVSIHVSPQARAACQEGCLTNYNTVLGEDVLLNDQGSSWNTANGFNALYSNNIGSVNTAIGFDALYSNTVGGYNTAIGSQALFSNTDAHNNTAIGVSALYSNNSGWNNTATGFGALSSNTIGTGNTANGVGALPSNTIGNFNTASGFNTLVFNNTGGGFVVMSGAASGPATFIFASEAGIISGWNSGVPPPPPSTHAQIGVTVPGAIYKGLAIAGSGGNARLYATNFHAGTVDVFDNNWKPVTIAGAFVDPSLPSGYAPFGVQNIGNTIYVTYALQDENKEDDVPGAGHGYINAFDTAAIKLARCDLIL